MGIARLHLRYKPEQLMPSEKAEQLLESGHVDQAIQLLGKISAVAQLLRSESWAIACGQTISGCASLLPDNAVAVLAYRCVALSGIWSGRFTAA